MLTSFLKLLLASLVSWLDIACPCHFLSTAPLTLQSSKVLNCPGLAARFFGVALTVSCITLVSVLSVFFFVFFYATAAAWCSGLLVLEVPFHPSSLAPLFSMTKEISVGGRGGACRVAMDTSSSC